MIKFECTDVWGFNNAIRGMRNPLNSWHKSDSDFCYAMPIDCATVCGNWDEFEGTCKFKYMLEPEYYIGLEDMDLCQRLIKGGPEHRKFLRQIDVAVDITAPLYWWKEFDTYKVGTVANSCSTMHTIHKKEFELSDFSCEHLIDLDINPYFKSHDEHPAMVMHNFIDPLNNTIRELNLARKLYLETEDKRYWWLLIQLLPTSYNQKRTITMNYEVLRSMYFQRRNHKLDEWREGFVEWVKSLPYANELIIFEDTNKNDE